MCHNSTHNINVIFIPEYLMGDVSEITTDMMKRFSSIEQLRDLDEVNFHLSDEDTYRYIILNEKLINLPSTRGIPLFKGFKSTLLESEWINEKQEEIEKYKKILDSTPPNGFDCNHPNCYGLPILGTIKVAYFDANSNTLVLTSSGGQPYMKDEDVDLYREWLYEVLAAIGARYPYDEIATTELFHEMVNERLRLDIVYSHEMNRDDDD